MFVVPIITKGHANTGGSGLPSKAVLVSEGHATTGPYRSVQPVQPQGAMVSNIRAQATAKSHVWVHGPTAVRVCSWLLIPSKTMSIPGFWASTSRAILASEGHAATEPVLMRVAYTATWDHGDIWTQVAAEDHVWIHDPVTTRVFVDV